MPETSPGTGRSGQAPLLEDLRSRRARAWHAAQDAWARAQAVQAQQAEAANLSPPDLLTVSLYARLQAQLATMPVIEQAKGVLMTQHGCDPGQAFDLLRRTSQRSHMPVRALAEQIVNYVQQPRSDSLSNGHSSSVPWPAYPGSRRHERDGGRKRARRGQSR